MGSVSHYKGRAYRFRWWGAVGEFYVDVSCPLKEFDRWALEEKIRELQMENTLLRNDLNTIKMEGCWRFVEDSKHEHKK